MAAQLSGYVAELGAALRRRDGRRAAELLALDSAAALIAHQLAASGRPLPAGPLASLPEPWGPMVAAYLRGLVAQSNGERVAACKEYREGYAAGLASILNADRGVDGEWLIPLALGATAALKALSEVADEQLTSRGAAASQLSECAIFLQKFFSGLATSKSSPAKRSASMAVVCVMMKVYFRLNAINNCKQPLRAIELNKLFDSAKQAHKVTLRYYTGRLAAYDEDFVLADEHLSYAFEHCSGTLSPRNVQRVLRYLIPVKMLLGVLPSVRLLQQYGLAAEYGAIRTAVAEGNLALLLSSLEANQVRFIQTGTYLLLERLQLLLLRRLLRRVALVHAELNPGKSHQLPLDLLEAALGLQGITKDPLELQCLVANLIFRKYVKGYLAFKSRVLVLAKADAFPPLSAVQLADPFA